MSKNEKSNHEAARAATEGGQAPVTVLGLGLMGSALAAAFLNQGHPTTVWNRSAQKADALVARGARRADSAREAVAASQVIVLCVLDYEAARDIVEPLGDALAGRVLVNLTSGTPDQVRRMAAWADERGVGYLDGGILSTPSGIGRPETLLLYSGAQALFDAHRPLLAKLGGATLHVGADPGLAVLYDMSLLGIMYSTMIGFLHALAVTGRENVDPVVFASYATKWLTAVTGFLPDMARQVRDRDYTGHEATLDMQAAGIPHFIRSSEDRGVDPAPMKYVLTLMHRAIAKGHGGHDVASLIEVI
ncbi:NAD(P)-dependent oxidoreductase [Pendulispora albinea]|uniref:NAD(P)-binding domain-containing protein n=1 Tax=Pendulispora albinea TaxID=2741071 RepID=A0ABZ2M6K4_9BACT